MSLQKPMDNKQLLVFSKMKPFVCYNWGPVDC